jgi:hypothetical protein
MNCTAPNNPLNDIGFSITLARPSRALDTPKDNSL